jgi:hypothetical protein
MPSYEIPGTVQGQLAMQIDRLPPRAKEPPFKLLQILRSEFNPDHLARLVELGEDRGAILGQLSHANFFSRVPAPCENS